MRSTARGEYVEPRKSHVTMDRIL